MNTRPHNRLARYVASAAIATLALAACSSSSHRNSSATTTAPDGNTSGSTAATATTAPSASTQATTTTLLGPSGPATDYPAAQTSPPSLAGAYPAGTTVNLIAVVKTLTTYEDWAYSHPNPALAANFMLTTGNDYASEVQNLTTLKQKGWHTDPTPTVIQWAKVERAPVIEPGSIDGHPVFQGGLITIVQVLSPGAYLNTAGVVVGHEPGGGPVAYSISLAQAASGAQTPDGQFRILDVTELHPPGGIAALEEQ